MAKIFITDEVNDSRSAQVTKGNQLRINAGAPSKVLVASAAASAAKTVVSSPCWLHKVIIAGLPSAAASLRIWDTSAAGNSSADGTGVSALSTALSLTGANMLLDMVLEPSAALSGEKTGLFPVVVPLDVYCASGICVEIGDTGAVNGGRFGGIKGLMITYTAA